MDDVTKWLAGLLAAIAIALSGWALAKVHSMAGDVKLIKHQISQTKDNEDDHERYEETLTKHWKIHGWTRDEVNKLRVKGGEEVTSWPDLHGH